jgi:hypothetical protein
MKESQWVVAAVLLAALVFVVVFASQWLGTGNQTGGPIEPPTLPPKLTLLAEPFDPKTATQLEVEDQTDQGRHDFFLVNDHKETIKVGLNRTSCKCSGVDIYLLPGDGTKWVASEFALLRGTAPGGPLNALASHIGVLGLMEREGVKHEMLSKNESIDVAPGGLCWARLHFKPRAGVAQTLTAELWCEDPNAPPIVLGTKVLAYEAYKVRPNFRVGTLKEEELRARDGVTRYIEVWSSTRPTFEVKARRVSIRSSTGADPCTVGTPVPMTPRELNDLARILEAEASSLVPTMRGPVVGGYRIPVNFKLVSADGKVPFEVGPFHRRVQVECEGLPGPAEGKSVLILGRVAGLIEIGDEPNSSEVRLGLFRRSRGANGLVTLSAGEAGVKIEFDREKTPKYLSAVVPKEPEVAKRKGVPYRWFWRVEVKALPNTVVGEFPRRDNVEYEDSAVYFRAVRKDGKVVPVRVVVSGSATESGR